MHTLWAISKQSLAFHATALWHPIKRKQEDKVKDEQSGSLSKRSGVDIIKSLRPKERTRERERKDDAALDRRHKMVNTEEFSRSSPRKIDIQI